MTWPVRSKLLGQYSATPAANTLITLGTVPAGKTWLVKDVVFHNSGAAARNLFLWATIGGVAYVVLQAPALAAAATSASSGRSIVLPAAGVLQFSSSTAQALIVYVSGAQLG